MSARAKQRPDTYVQACMGPTTAFDGHDLANGGQQRQLRSRRHEECSWPLLHTETLTLVSARGAADSRSNLCP